MESPPQPNQPTGPPVLQTIVNKPYEEIKAFSEWLKRNTSNYLIGEHPPGKSKGIHCHILIEGLKVSREALRKQVIKLAPGRGQNATMAETQNDRRKYETAPLAIYIIKGHEDYSKSTTFSQAQIKAWADAWVQPIARNEFVAAASVKKKPSNKFEDVHEILDTITIPIRELIDSATNRQIIVRAIIAWANDKHKAMNSYLVADYYDEILKQGIPDYYQTIVVALINHRHRFAHI